MPAVVERTPEPLVLTIPPAVFSPEKVIAPDDVRPVAPEIDPVFDNANDGVLMKLLKPVEEPKLIPLMTFVPLLVADSKLMPLSVLVLLPFVAFDRARSSPLTATVETPAFELVIVFVSEEELFVDVENV